jgi:hypothetical protein
MDWKLIFDPVFSASARGLVILGLERFTKTVSKNKCHVTRVGLVDPIGIG